MCDTTGFQFAAMGRGGKQVALMGDTVKRTEVLKLMAKLPVPAYVRLLRHGTEVATSEAKTEFEFLLTEPGVYRLEAFLKLDDEHRPWIYANPIYVR
jgi:hypothetical protein